MAYLETATRRLIVRFRGSVGLGVSCRIGKQYDRQTGYSQQPFVAVRHFRDFYGGVLRRRSSEINKVNIIYQQLFCNHFYSF